jgi:hypothetical protein
MGIESLHDYLQDRVDDRYRGMVKYDSSGIRIEYLRDDLQEQRLQSQFERMIERLSPEATQREQNAFPLGELHATLRYFDEALVLHLPTSQHGGLVVSLEPDVARQFNSFVNDCHQELHTFQRGEDEELP